MDDATQPIRAFMTSMHRVRDALDECVRELYLRPEVKLAKRYDPTPYLSSDFGVSVELRNGAVVDLWLELDSNDAGWSLHPTVQRHDPEEDGSHTERDLGVRNVSAADTLPGEVTQALRELRSATADDRLFR